MNGQMKNYKEYMSQDYKPISLYSMPYTVDMRGLREYANLRGMKIVDLSDEEISQFLVKNIQYRP